MSTTVSAKTESHYDQLERLKGEVDALRLELRRVQRLATMGTMASMVAHEFNNILTPIMSYAQLAKENPSFADKAIASAADGSRRATHICNAILGFSRTDLKVREANLATLIGETMTAMAREPRKDGIDFVLEAPANLTVRTRAVELQQVLLNLIINARRAVLAGTQPRRITINAAKKGGKVSIHVSDTGVGIPPENLEKIFLPFFTTKDASDEDSAGHGLGLAISKDIITSLGGKISVQSTPGKGTTFTVVLPA